MANDRVTPRLSQPMLRYLQDLLKTGLHGDTIDGVARSLIESAVRDAVADGLIKARRGAASSPHTRAKRGASKPRR